MRRSQRTGSGRGTDWVCEAGRFARCRKAGSDRAGELGVDWYVVSGIWEYQSSNFNIVEAPPSTEASQIKAMAATSRFTLS